MNWSLKIILTALFAVVFLPLIIKAQVTNQIETNIGVSSIALRDRSMSPLIYSGLGFSGALGYQRKSESKIRIFKLSHSRSGINNQFGNSCAFRSLAFKTFALYRINSGDGNFSLGWSNNNFFNYYKNQKFRNFSERSNYYTTFGLAGHYEKQINFSGRDFVFSVPVDIQLAGFYLRPSYVSNSPEGYLDPDNSGFGVWFKSIEAFLSHRAWNFGLNPNLSFIFKNGNALSVNYEYEFFRINNPEPISQSAGGWFISLTTRL
jgi:hypothetical protein